ncbi:T6SS effector amidase Tae4 family protein [Pedobacter ghigonis]|uniref:T6SS effector amidase Tae4 family protein n=1 Tax=Pedobacter ghigonis TaxID=2730403 RepID=UPI00158BDB49|nr:T6SS effector amidase Tae4 family protein [Pedobacter ghigonis]
MKIKRSINPPGTTMSVPQSFPFFKLKYSFISGLKRAFEKGNLLPFICGIVVILLVSSCQKNLLVDKDGAVIAKARQWYEDQALSTQNYIRLEGKGLVAVKEKPDWDQAVATELDDNSVVITMPVESSIFNTIKKNGNLQLVLEVKNGEYKSRYVGNTQSLVNNKPVTQMYARAFGQGDPLSGKAGAPATTNSVQCSDWYWVVKNWVNGEWVITDVEYLGRTCDGDFEGGGGGGGTGNPGGSGDPGNGDFGENPSCKNCVVSGDNFLSLKAYVRSIGLNVHSPFSTTLTVDGVQYQGQMVQIRTADGSLVASYFSPDSDSSLFPSGYFYNIGNKGSDGTNTTNSAIVIPNGTTWSFGTTPTPGGGTANITYTRSSEFQTFINLISANSTEIAYMDNHYKIIELLNNYMSANGQTSDNIEFSKWAVGYLSANPSVSLETFINQFLNSNVSKDGDFDEAYWSNPNLSVPAQQLPSFQAYNNAFPKKDGGYMPAAEVYSMIGGQLYTSHLANPSQYSNACAVRVSRALNYSGVVVPSISGQTEKGTDNKNYFLSAANLNAWMKKTFTTYTTFTGAQGGKNGRNFPTLLNGKKGIYIMIPNYPAYFASGHADVWNGTNCNGECYFNIEADLPGNRKQGIAFINLWELN